MWDFKLLLLNLFFFIHIWLNEITLFFIDLIYPFYHNSFFLINWITFTSFPFNSSIFFGFKFCLCIAFLILIRGGTPRYRYDYLTKLGWLKFLSLVLLIFSFSIVFYFLF